MHAKKRELIEWEYVKLLQIVHTEWITHIALENYQKWQGENIEYKQKQKQCVCMYRKTTMKVLST